MKMSDLPTWEECRTVFESVHRNFVLFEKEYPLHYFIYQNEPTNSFGDVFWRKQLVNAVNAVEKLKPIIMSSSQFDTEFRSEILQEVKENGVSYQSALETLYELYCKNPQIFEG